MHPENVKWAPIQDHDVRMSTDVLNRRYKNTLLPFNCTVSFCVLFPFVLSARSTGEYSRAVNRIAPSFFPGSNVRVVCHCYHYKDTYYKIVIWFWRKQWKHEFLRLKLFSYKDATTRTRCYQNLLNHMNRKSLKWNIYEQPDIERGTCILQYFQGYYFS